MILRPALPFALVLILAACGATVTSSAPDVSDASPSAADDARRVDLVVPGVAGAEGLASIGPTATALLPLAPVVRPGWYPFAPLAADGSRLDAPGLQLPVLPLDGFAAGAVVYMAPGPGRPWVATRVR